MAAAHHALVLNLHQPAGNLEHLLAHEPWEAEMILYAMDRIPRTLWRDEDIGRVHLSTASSTAAHSFGTCRTAASSASSEPATTIPCCR